jgi:hypothetical protein
VLPANVPTTTCYPGQKGYAIIVLENLKSVETVALAIALSDIDMGKYAFRRGDIRSELLATCGE